MGGGRVLFRFSSISCLLILNIWNPTLGLWWAQIVCFQITQRNNGIGFHTKFGIYTTRRRISQKEVLCALPPAALPAHMLAVIQDARYSNVQGDMGGKSSRMSRCSAAATTASFLAFPFHLQCSYDVASCSHLAVSCKTIVKPQPPDTPPALDTLVPRTELPCVAFAYVTLLTR
jgi:hypothetical protein